MTEPLDDYGIDIDAPVLPDDDPADLEPDTDPDTEEPA